MKKSHICLLIEKIKRKMVYVCLSSMLLLSACGEQSKDVFRAEAIYYSSWLEGEWQTAEVMTYSILWRRIHESCEVVDSYIGEIYDLTGLLSEEVSGGVVPIRDRETQKFFHGEGYLSDLELSGNYYAMFWIDTEEWDGTTCFVIKDKKEWLVWKDCYGVYRLQRTGSDGEQMHVYDANLSFEDNIKKRMDEQGIRRHIYFNNVWEGYWTIEEVVCSEDEAEAQMHLGEMVNYNGAVYFDINFIESGEDRIFYHMPTTGELGLDGAYYLLIWDEDNEYPAAIVASEHEIFLIRGNTLFRAVQEEEYLEDCILQGL